jgi:hypothetical protein
MLLLFLHSPECKRRAVTPSQQPELFLLEFQVDALKRTE